MYACMDLPICVKETKRETDPERGGGGVGGGGAYARAGKLSCRLSKEKLPRLRTWMRPLFAAADMRVPAFCASAAADATRSCTASIHPMIALAVSPSRQTHTGKTYPRQTRPRQANRKAHELGEDRVYTNRLAPESMQQHTPGRTRHTHKHKTRHSAASMRVAKGVELKASGVPTAERVQG